MVEMSKRRTLLETMRAVIFFLTEEEIRDIGLVLQRAIERIEKEVEG